MIGILKAAFVQGMLSKDEFDQRVGQAFGSRTCTELVALTADLHVEPIAARSPEPAGRHGEEPVLRAGTVLAGATAICGSVWAFTFLPPWPMNSEGEPPHGVLTLFLLTNLVYVCVLVAAVVQMLVGWCEKRSDERRRPAAGAGSQ